MCNRKYCKIRSDNKTGVKGIVKKAYKKSFGYLAMIYFNGRQHYLGSFPDIDEAICHRLAAEQCMNWHEQKLDSTAYKYVKKNIQGETS